MTEPNKTEIICAKCKVPLVNKKARFLYLGHEMHSEVPRCPKCGQIYLSEELVRGRIADVEASLEDK